MREGQAGMPQEGQWAEHRLPSERLSEMERASTALCREKSPAPSISTPGEVIETSGVETLNLQRQPGDDRWPRQDAWNNDTLNEALDRAKTEARCLLESAIAAHSRAEAISEALQREIHRRKQLETALEATERRYRWVLDAIGSLHGLSVADRESLLRGEPSPSFPERRPP